MSDEIEWWEYDDAAEMADAVAGDIGFIIESAIEARGAAVIALAGGKTPVPVYEKLAAAKLDWKRVTIVPTDERIVPLGDPLSNVTMIGKTFIPKGARVIPIVPKAMDDYKAAGRSADALMRDLHWPLDLCLLGVGADGHTASIFPGPDYDVALNGPRERRASHAARLERDVGSLGRDRDGEREVQEVPVIRVAVAVGPAERVGRFGIGEVKARVMQRIDRRHQEPSGDERGGGKQHVLGGVLRAACLGARENMDDRRHTGDGRHADQREHEGGALVFLLGKALDAASGRRDHHEPDHREIRPGACVPSDQGTRDGREFAAHGHLDEQSGDHADDDGDQQAGMKAQQMRKELGVHGQRRSEKVRTFRLSTKVTSSRTCDGTFVSQKAAWIVA